LKPGAKIVRDVVVVTVWLPEVPVTVGVYCPGVAVLLVEINSTLLPVVGFGEKDPVTPLGKPDTESVTFPVNPYCGYTPT
jgi:hypothetical protein